MKTMVLCLLIAVFLIVSVLSPPVSGQEKVDAKNLFEKKCNICHNAGKATSLKKTPPEWEATVLRMQKERKAPVNDMEAKAIIDYLSVNYSKPAK